MSLRVSLKEICEAQILEELSQQDTTLAGLFPNKQSTENKLSFPHIAVVCTVGKEVSPGALIHNITLAVEVHFKHPISQPEELDDVCARIIAALRLAQARGDYGLILDGEQSAQFVSDTVRKRVIQGRIIAAAV